VSLIAGMQKISAQTLEFFLSKEHDKHLLFLFAANQHGTRNPKFTVEA
jgi:hypothetical protein